MRSPVRTPVPTTSGFTLKYRLQTLSNTGSRSGPTQPMAASPTSSGETPPCARRSDISTQYSSAVLRTSVAKRQVAPRESPSKTPIVTLVLLTFIARITSRPAPPNAASPLYQGSHRRRDGAVLAPPLTVRKGATFARPLAITSLTPLPDGCQISAIRSPQSPCFDSPIGG